VIALPLDYISIALTLPRHFVVTFSAGRTVIGRPQHSRSSRFPLHSSIMATKESHTEPRNGKSFTTKTLTTTDGTRYVYSYASAEQDKPTVLLFHGFPATRHDWTHQVEKLAVNGYGVIAPDLLGYGDTDRPTDLAAFRLKSMSEHLTEILDTHNLKTVVGVAHDWGTVVLSRSIYWHPERYEKVVFVSSGYSPAGMLFDIDAVNAYSLANLGYCQYGYWYFFNSYDAESLLESRVCILTILRLFLTWNR
jgi:pimeloyl-ACP methyl ester carboxylesterase